MNWLADLPSVATVDCADGIVPERICDGESTTEPVLLRGLVGKWPALACDRSITEAARYLGRFGTKAPVTVYVGDAAIAGRFFYNETLTDFNFRSGKAPLPQVLERLAETNRSDALATIYVGSTPVDQWLPGFRADNDLRWPVRDALASFWLGNETRISAHFDFPNNIACVVAGERRFTLLPPDQIGNLYVGPMEKTPAGQPISLVDFHAPDLQRHPRFAEAAEHAKAALLKPGDALFIPSMWWHHVESLAAFNLLVNYWWCDTPAYLGSPSLALWHAMLSIRALPSHQRQAWRGLFEHYVFNADESVHQHIPEQGKGYLADFDESTAKQLRAHLLNKLNQ